MSVWIHVDGQPVTRCESYRQHLHTRVTRVHGRADPRVGGKTTHEDFVVTRRPDHLTPVLLHACATGTMLESLAVESRRAPEGERDEDAPPTTYDEERPGMRYTLHEVYVTAVLASVEDDGPLETVSMSYARVRWAWEGDEAVTTAWPDDTP